MELSVGEVLHADRQLFTGFVRDLSERRKADRRLQELQTELVHVSRLSEMGQMATMVAHELNQPLSAITNYMNGGIRLLERDGDLSRPMLREAMERSAAQARRAGHIIKRLRDFVSHGEIERRFEPIPRSSQRRLSWPASPSGRRMFVSKLAMILLTLLFLQTKFRFSRSCSICFETPPRLWLSESTGLSLSTPTSMKMMFLSASSTMVLVSR
jgi:signal transduction histidine kinase